MRRFRYSRRADADMVGIARFSLARFGEAQTEKYLQQLEAAIDKAAAAPNSMRPRRELGEHIYSVRCQAHVAFLTPDKATGNWLVVAVLHGRMDPTRHIEPEPEDN